MNLVDELYAIARALLGVRYAICGGVAVAIHGWVRTTRDINIAEGHARLREEAMAPDSIAATVDGRLDELRALSELTNVLLGVARPAKR